MRLKCQLALICALAASRFTVMLRALAEVNRLFLVRLAVMLHVPGVAMSYTNLNICTQVGINGLLSANNVTHTYRRSA